MNEQEIRDYKDINASLIKWGWLVSPYYTGRERKHLMSLASKIDTLHGKKEKDQVSTEIGSLILQSNLNYHFRAVTVFEGYRSMPNMKKFSHLFEAGLLEFYQFNYIACLGIWIPIVEGITRSMIGITFSRHFQEDLMKELRAKFSCEQPFLDMIIDVLLRFYKEVFYCNVNSLSDLSSQNFNRHFFSHSISHQPLYCRDNGLKLLNVFDTLLAIDFIVDQGFRAFFDGKDKRIKLREKYYENVLRNGLSGHEMFKLDLLKDHPHFDETFYYQKRPFKDLKS